MKKIFVDGLTGTTGLLIHERLSHYDQIEILKIDEHQKKNLNEKKKFLNAADIVFLCLPDQAAKESVALIDNPNTKVIDASTAHRIHKDWAYGIPELSKDHRNRIMSSSRVANPGCHASAFALAIYPLVKAGILGNDYPISLHTLTGYSGGGKELISKYEDSSEFNPYLRGPRHYRLGLDHKHLPEMKIQTGLSEEPLFNPIVGNFYKGLVATIPIKMSLMKIKKTGREIQQFLADYYKDAYFVRVNPYDLKDNLFEGGFDVTGSNDTNYCDLFVFSNEEKGTMVLMSRLDNLGKGASGAALQNMNIMLGLDEWTHLI
ncbi:N-acetyl-gamma-glutamyl-phosphate reductase [Petrocella sp. FN5]|uniref:N-acetyl-gamma-glutamyl-phosphate reductase n=1 Tax=Petrocella sp. FN5 TaxID=3032002 RepID=UPI0023DA387C|nr:N-acetyl-gamma-glutamyl-phosphate reductase [Petrocella sp. FN5]MDF1616223.1 N-acetyl-gamma-glutamyl-phosphate reductase [Petrocella sp. FN5]